MGAKVLILAKSLIPNFLRAIVQCHYASSRICNLRSHLKTHSGEKSEEEKCIPTYRQLEGAFGKAQ